jgi:hypothetical protein
MSRHWNPGEDLARARSAQAWTHASSYLPAGRGSWSDGVKAALVIAVGGCVFLASGFFQIVGP